MCCQVLQFSHKTVLPSSLVVPHMHLITFSMVVSNRVRVGGGSSPNHSGTFLICCHMKFSRLLALFTCGVVSLVYMRQLSNISVATSTNPSGVMREPYFSLSS